MIIYDVYTKMAHAVVAMLVASTGGHPPIRWAGGGRCRMVGSCVRGREEGREATYLPVFYNRVKLMNILAAAAAEAGKVRSLPLSKDDLQDASLVNIS